MQIEKATVRTHDLVGGDYRELVLDAPVTAGAAVPGQFVHLRVPRLDGSVLRRPFSIYRARDGRLAILYKTVGRGTKAMEFIAAGDVVDMIGPLGNGFPLDAIGGNPALVAGGYGVAPLSFLVTEVDARGTVFIGGATARDILCVGDFESLGWTVHITTEDGSLGEKGLVTAALDAWLAKQHDTPPVYYACGPDGMLRAVGARAVRAGHTAWLSLDKHMGCGVGACLACVQKIRGEDGSVSWKRVCKDGPIFEASVIEWDT
jgi:dihydroorotate dehydrogenase electron transfer subunit